MKQLIINSFILIISTLSLNALALTSATTFINEKSFSFSANPTVLETNHIQIYSGYHSFEQAKASELLQKIDVHNILQQYYGNIGDVLVTKEIFLINAPQAELGKKFYKQPSAQSILFPSMNFSDCNATSCTGKQNVMGTNVSFTAFYTHSKKELEETYIMDQFATNWSMGFNNTISFSVISKYSATASIITSYQILILKNDIDFLKKKVSSEVKKQVLDFYSCFQSNRCQKNAED